MLNDCWEDGDAVKQQQETRQRRSQRTLLHFEHKHISSFLFCLAEMSSMYETQERGQAGAIDYY